MEVEGGEERTENTWGRLGLKAQAKVTWQA